MNPFRKDEKNLIKGIHKKMSWVGEGVVELGIYN